MKFRWGLGRYVTSLQRTVEVLRVVGCPADGGVICIARSSIV